MGTKILGNGHDVFQAHKERKGIFRRKVWKAWRIDGNGGNDSLTGGPWADVIYGNEGNDRLVGGSGHDFLSGGANHDILVGNRGNDTLVGGGGNDYLVGTDFPSQGNGERDVLYSGSWSDTDIFVLGERYGTGRVFYNDRGNSDYAVIKDFDVHNYRGDIADRIQLLGSASAYSLRNGSWNGVDGVGIYFGGDVIGVVQGFTTSQLNLYDSKQFVYV